MASDNIKADMSNLTVEALSEKIAPLQLKNPVFIEKAVLDCGVKDSADVTTICILVERRISPFAYWSRLRYGLTKLLVSLEFKISTFYSGETASRLVSSNYQAEDDIQGLLHITYHLLLCPHEGNSMYRAGITRRLVIERNQAKQWLHSSDKDLRQHIDIESAKIRAREADEAFEGLLKHTLSALQRDIGLCSQCSELIRSNVNPGNIKELNNVKLKELGVIKGFMTPKTCGCRKISPNVFNMLSVMMEQSFINQ